MHEDALSLPLVAYRGLWDKFAGPGSAGAFRRSYLRGVPSVVRVGIDEPGLSDALTLVANRALNRSGQPLFLVSSSFPGKSALAPLAAALIEVFVIPIETHGDLPSKVWVWKRNYWRRAGWYVPVGARVRIPEERSPFVLFESQNVVTDLTIRSRFGVRDDDETLGTIRAATQSQPTIIARVSDLVELDLLDQRMREAS